MLASFRILSQNGYRNESHSHSYIRTIYSIKNYGRLHGRQVVRTNKKEKRSQTHKNIKNHKNLCAR